MSGKLGEVESRIGTVHQLEAVITAMRGSAAARSREARSRLDGIRAYAAAIGEAIGQALALTPESDPPLRKPQSPEGHGVIVLCAEQGFVGTFNERILDAAERHLKSNAAELLIIGDRGAMVAAERGLVFGWSAPMVAHAEEVPLLASRITDALYSRLEKDQATRVTVIHAVPAPSAAIEIVERALLPFDFERFKVAPLGPSDNDPAAGAAPCGARRGVCLRRAVRGGDAVLRRRKRGAHGGDDRRAQQCGAQARRTRRELPSPAPRGDYRRDHRALRRQHTSCGLRQAQAEPRLGSEPLENDLRNG